MSATPACTAKVTVLRACNMQARHDRRKFGFECLHSVDQPRSRQNHVADEGR
jgi:hypothetical protein